MGADRIQAGPLSQDGRNHSDQQAIVMDSANGTLSVSASDHVLRLLRSAIVVLPTQTALTAITTAQTVLSKAFNAGALSVVGRRVRIKGKMIYSTTVGNVATIAFALTLGGVTLCTITTPATNTAASSNLPLEFEFEFTVATAGSAATLTTNGKVTANIGTVAAAVANAYLDTNTAVSSAVNLAAAATLAVTIAGSAAIPSAQLLDAVIEYVA